MKERIKTSLILTAAVIAVSLALALVKLYVGLSSNSLCIMLDATNSFLDILTGIVAFCAFALLLKPKKGFGLGRGEYVAGFVVAVVSVVFGGVFLLRSVNRIAMPEPVWFDPFNCALIAAAVPIKLALAAFLYVKNKKLQSKAVAAIALDSFLDAGITSASLISFAVSGNVNYAIDAIFGIVISVIVIIFGLKLVLDNVKLLLVGEDAKEERAAIERICDEDKDVVRVVGITLHDYGFGNKNGCVEVEYRYGMTIEEAELHGKALAARIMDACGATVLLVPTSH